MKLISNKRKPNCLQTIVAIGCISVASTFLQGQIVVQEIPSSDGDSVIQVRENGKLTATYPICLSRHHAPARSQNDPLMKKWSSFRFGAFLCYNLNQYVGNELSEGKDPSLFTPDKLNVRQWISTLKAAGMDHAILTVRHTSDFLLWDSKTSKCTSMYSPVKRDIVKEYVTECRRQGIQPGIYYCVFGNKNWNYNPNARAIILAQLHELATNYGPIPYFWIDMAFEEPNISWCWRPENLSRQEIYDSLKNANPGTIVKMNNGQCDGTRISSFPSDVLNGENFLPPEGGHRPERVIGGTRYYIPFEYEPISQKRLGENEDPVSGRKNLRNGTWFTYGKGKSFLPSSPLDVDLLYQLISEARRRGANTVLLSCAPDHSGQFRAEDVRQLVELGRRVKPLFEVTGEKKSFRGASGK